MLAASKPCARNTARAPSMIWRRLALSSAPSDCGGRTATAASLAIVPGLPAGSNLPSRINMAYSHANINDRTVRSILTFEVSSFIKMTERFGHNLAALRNRSSAMYLDREDGVRMPRRARSTNLAAAQAVEAQA